MKNRVLIISLLILTSCIPLYADGGWHRYYDFSTTNSGRASITYMGTTLDCIPSQDASELEDFLKNDIVGYCRKISKRENFLIWSALSEYDYSDGEVYGIVVQEDGNDAALYVIVTIENNGNSYRWYGGFYVE